MKKHLQNPLAFAIDVPTTSDADHLIHMLEPHVGAFKIGLELFIIAHSNGWWPKTERPIILDLKLYDIPETVRRAVRAAAKLGVDFMTIHVQQPEAMRLALEVAEMWNIQLLDVTVLSSMSMDNVVRVMPVRAHEWDVSDVVVSRASMARANSGLNGFVCPATAVKRLRHEMFDAFLMVPGIRPAGADTHDQQSVGTPEQAVRDGANIIVVGRPIRDAEDPVAAARAIVQSLSK